MIGITIGFVLITTLVLWYIIGSKGHWVSKAAIILLSLYFCLSVGFSLNELMGWPTKEELPKKFFLHWAVVEEPDPKTGEEGSIFIWTKPLDSTRPKDQGWQDYLLSFYDGESQPRAHELPYSRELHEQAQEALEMIMGGQSVGGISIGEPGDGEGEGGEGDGEVVEGSAEGSLTRNGGVIFHKLPPPKLPDKRGNK